MDREGQKAFFGLSPDTLFFDRPLDIARASIPEKAVSHCGESPTMIPFAVSAIVM
jgi:hypothetical protein